MGDSEILATTASLNRWTSLFSDLIGKKVDDSFLWVPPFYTTGGVDISGGRNVLVNRTAPFMAIRGRQHCVAVDRGDGLSCG